MPAVTVNPTKWVVYHHTYQYYQCTRCNGVRHLQALWAHDWHHIWIAWHDLVNQR